MGVEVDADGYTRDGQGNPAQTKYCMRNYDVYGLVRSGPAGVGKQKFCGNLGHTSDDETGLIYMRARYMDPALGRFISEDKAKDGANWYVYCKSNSIAWQDSNGSEASWRDAADLGAVLVGGFFSNSAFALLTTFVGAMVMFTSMPMVAAAMMTGIRGLANGFAAGAYLAAVVGPQAFIGAFTSAYIDGKVLLQGFIVLTGPVAVAAEAIGLAASVYGTYDYIERHLFD